MCHVNRTSLLGSQGTLKTKMLGMPKLFGGSAYDIGTKLCMILNHHAAA